MGRVRCNAAQGEQGLPAASAGRSSADHIDSNEIISTILVQLAHQRSQVTMVGRIKENSPKISTLPENDVCEFESSSGHLDTHFSCAAL